MGQAVTKQEAFWEACGFGHTERVRRFLKEGVDVNWVSYTHDCCPIHVASQGKPQIVKMLIDAGCNVNVKDIRGNLPIHHAAMKGHHDIIQTLIDAGSEIDTPDKNGWTALHCAAYWCHPKAVEALLKNNCIADLQNKDERTPLHETARSKVNNDPSLREITQMLIDAGADLNSKSSDLGEADFTCLMYASYHGHPEIVSLLLESGCEMNSFGTNGWTALHWAADRGQEEVVIVLVEAGIDPTIRGLRGETAADRAKNPEIKELLMNACNMHNELRSIGRPPGSSSDQITTELQAMHSRIESHGSPTKVVRQSQVTKSPSKTKSDLPNGTECENKPFTELDGIAVLRISNEDNLAGASEAQSDHMPAGNSPPSSLDDVFLPSSRQKTEDTDSLYDNSESKTESGTNILQDAKIVQSAPPINPEELLLQVAQPQSTKPRRETGSLYDNFNDKVIEEHVVNVDDGLPSITESLLDNPIHQDFIKNIDGSRDSGSIYDNSDGKGELSHIDVMNDLSGVDNVSPSSIDEPGQLEKDWNFPPKASGDTDSVYDNLNA